MATIRKRGDYQWEARVRRRGYPTQSKTLNTKIEAEAWAREVEAEMDRGVFESRSESESTTLGQALDRFDRERNLSDSREQYRSLLNIWKRDPLALRFLSQIKGKDLAEWRTRREATGVGPQTVIHELNLISRVFNAAIREWGMGGLQNPVQKIRKPKLPLARDRRLAPGELDRILAASGSPVLSDLAQFAIETAMRESEIARMEWHHVDLRKKVYFMPYESQRKPTRNVPLSPGALAILERIPRRLDGKVWGVTGHAISVAWRRAVARARKAYEKECEERNEKPDPAFLVDLTFHDLRHEATSRFFEKGLNPMQVAAITGHKTLQMLKRYTHLKAEDLAEMLK